MAGTFKFELVSPERILLSADAEEVVVPGFEGEFTVLPGHAPVISALRPGIIDVKGTGQRRRLLVKSGVVEVNPEAVTVLAERAFDLAEVSPAQIAEEIKLAEAEREAAVDDQTHSAASTLIELLESFGHPGGIGH